MKLKLTFLLIFLSGFFCFYSNAQQVRLVEIKGQLINCNNRTQLLDFSELSEIRLQNNDLEIIPDKAGFFVLKFKLAHPNYYRLGYNLLCLQPGDKLEVKIDFTNSLNSVFNGTGSELNNYLKSVPSPKAGSYLDGGLNLKKSIPESIANVLLLAKTRRAKLDSVKNLTSEVLSYERARIDGDVISSFKLLPTIFTYRNKISGKDQQQIFKEVDSLTAAEVRNRAEHLVQSKFLKVETIRANSYRIIEKGKGDVKNVSEIKDWQYAKELFRIVAATNNKAELLKLSSKTDSIKNIDYRKAAKESLEQKLRFGNGDIAKDIVAFNTNNETFKISSLKGKFIFIDFWATWCGPCLDEMPYLDDLRKKYENNKNIVFISLCVNDNVNNWKKNLAQRKPTGLQLFADQLQTIDYQLVSLPRAVLIDKDFKVMMLNGPTPSNTGLIPYLDGILK